MSFIRNAQDVAHILDALAEAGGADLGLVLKIETRQGFENLPSILLEGMRHPRSALMIAAATWPSRWFERMSEVPRQILQPLRGGPHPHHLGHPGAGVAGEDGQPSRAEITDAAAGQRADCVMLNKGPHIEDAIRALGRHRQPDVPGAAEEPHPDAAHPLLGGAMTPRFLADPHPVGAATNLTLRGGSGRTGHTRFVGELLRRSTVPNVWAMEAAWTS